MIILYYNVMWYITASLKLAGTLERPTAAGAPQSQISLGDVLDSKSSSVLKHLGEIADSMYEWEGAVAENLKLTPADIVDIKTQYPKKMNLQVLVTTPLVHPLI